MKRHDSEVISTTSSTSKGSERKKNRFSIRRILSAGRTGLSRMSLNSALSAQSDYGFSVISVSEQDQVLGATAAPTSAVTVSVPTLSEKTSSQIICAPRNDGMRECPLCLIDHPSELFPDISTCDHRSCTSCLKTYLKIEITESRVNIACPECAEKFHPNDIKEILGDLVLMSKYEDFMVRRVLVADPDARWCPAPDCGYAVIATECAGCPKIKCERPGCNTYFCYHCKQYWHPNKTCDAARAERAIMTLVSGSVNYSPDSETQNSIKPCPRCSAFIIKENDGSCNHMTCTVCGAEFCWLCMKEISDLHYLSPSGCTFWGKKPWSRKKKILWQLGTLVGAPVGITLLAGIAVPAMIIGIPVWVGKKIHSRFENSTKHKHNLAVVGGVTASVIISPVVAGLAVGIGVPMLLGYVYGVVPISLCRSGGCGVRTTNSGGVRFEFEENETGASSMYPGGIDSQSVGTGHQVPNPSIAPSIGEASVGMNNSIYSGSMTHIDRVGVNREDESDRDSASHRAIAGSSLNGSMCGSTYASVIGMQTRLEVQAELESDVPTGKRASFSSASANFSIGEKSLGEKSGIGDDASTRGLAGSIANYKFENASTSDIHMDIKVSSTKSDSDTSSSRQTSPHDAEILSVSSKISHDEKENRKKTSSCPGSPQSNCGSLLEHEDGSRHVNSRCRKCRRAAKLAEKHVTEQMNVHFSDQVSLQSFQADDAVLDLPMGKHDIDSLSEMCNEDEFDSDEALDRCGKRRSSGRINSEPAVILTEVESDRRGFLRSEREKDKHKACDNNLSSDIDTQKSTVSLSQAHSDGSSNDVVLSLNSSLSSMSMKYCKYEKREEKILSKCRSEEIFKKQKNQINEAVSEKSKSEELYNKDSDVIGGAMKRTRRESCELAMKEGRISPCQEIDL